jgi:hypothetical protein
MSACHAEDRGFESRRFRLDCLLIFLVLLKCLFFRVEVSSLLWLSCLRDLNTLISDVLLIPPLHMNSARMGLQVVLFSHHPRTDIPSSQHTREYLVDSRFEVVVDCHARHPTPELEDRVPDAAHSNLRTRLVLL